MPRDSIHAGRGLADLAAAATREAVTVRNRTKSTDAFAAANAAICAGDATANAAARGSPVSRIAAEDAADTVTFISRISKRSVILDASLKTAAASAVGSDSEFIKGSRPAKRLAAAALANAKLWPSGMHHVPSSAWSDLKRVLLEAGDDWDVWIRWYEDRLGGRSSISEAFDAAVATLPNSLWKSGPKAVNSRIKELIEEHAPSNPIPTQGAGPHFDLSPAHRIALAAASDIDAEGNNFSRLRQQLPLVREAADDLAGRLNPNAFPELTRNLAGYRAAIEGEPETIAWGIVFTRGVRLDNAAAAARRQIEDRLQPPLEDAAQEALESVLTLHGPMVLATAEGRDLMGDADRMVLTREQQAALRSDALAVATALHENKEVVEPPAAAIVMEAVETMGQGPHPERGSAIGSATIRNVTIWAVGIGAVAAIAGVGFVQAGAAVFAIEGLKKSQRFSALTDALGTRIDGILRTGTAFQNFVLRNEQPLRQMASNSAGMRWMLPYIDDVVRRNAGKSQIDRE